MKSKIRSVLLSLFFLTLTVHSLRDEDVIYNLFCVAQQYFEKRSFNEATNRMKFRRIEHIYYKVSVDCLSKVSLKLLGVHGFI